MGDVLALPTTGAPLLGAAVRTFLAGIGNAHTRRAYAVALRALEQEFGATSGLDALEGEAAADRVATWFASRWGSASANTVNARLRALASACSWWRDQNWLIGDPLRRIRARPVPPDRTRALAREQVRELLGRGGLALREKTLWRLLYESAARASEVLALDVADLDLRNRRARVQLPPQDLDPATGRARLSYRRAEELFAAAAGGATLRHSALTHAAEEGANTSTLMAYSGHTSVGSLAKYARVSVDALGAWQAERDPASRRGAR